MFAVELGADARRRSSGRRKKGDEELLRPPAASRGATNEGLSLSDFAETFSSVQFSSVLRILVMMTVGEPQDEQEVVPDLLLSGGRDEMGT